MVVYQALQVNVGIMRHVLAKFLSMRFVINLGVRHDHVNQPVTHDSEHNMTGLIHHHADCDQ